MRRFFYGTVMAVAVGCCHAQINAPLEIKGFWLGMPKAKAVEIGNLRCGHLPQSTICAKDHSTANDVTRTVAGVPMLHFHVNILPNETVGSIYLTFAASDFSKVQQAVAAKYRGLKCKSSTVQNRMGATFDQVGCELEMRDQSLMMEKRSSDIDTSSISLTSDAQLKQYEQEEKTKQERAKKDL